MTPYVVMRLRRAVIDIRAERVQRNAPFAVPLRARDFRAVQPSGNAHLDPLGPDAHRVRNGPPHRAPELHAPFELLRDALSDQGRIELGLADLGNIDANVVQRHTQHRRDGAVRSFSMSSPFLPMTIPGRAVCTVMFARFAGRSM